MSKFYLDAGTTYSKIITIGNGERETVNGILGMPVKQLDGKNYYIVPSKLLKTLNIQFEKSCGHMFNIPSLLGGEPAPQMAGTEVRGSHENEIIALAQGCKNIMVPNATVLDLGSRDAKWIRFEDNKFKDMDWNTSCASSTGATVEMLLKFYDVKAEELLFSKQKFPVTCGIFGLEKIMDDISKGAETSEAISKFIHGIAYNAWSFAKKPQKIYLSGGFCENKCFLDSLKNYCEVETLGRFVLCEGLIEQ